ncbi:hypothetical protein SAMN04487834_106917 [Sharpea azabuensis]|uniref:Uncharacterized protein n=2 Tax=Sharpea azabuensis TaxID=322505 RepID=A0A1H6WQN6_9FIRM|nr:hypothetical protein SAMN04487834_106917 [Sharpea azabuensis]
MKQIMTNKEIADNLRKYDEKVKRLIEAYKELLDEYNSQDRFIKVQNELVRSQGMKVKEQHKEIIELKETIRRLESIQDDDVKKLHSKVVRELKKENKMLKKRLDFECDITVISKEELYKDFCRLREMNKRLIREKRGSLR